MSPEQARGLPVDARTDVWSLGVVLYEMVAGQQPFEGATPTDVIISIAGLEPEPLARYAPEVPTELERIVKKALAKDREERYQTAEDLLIDLRNLKLKLEVDAEIDRTVPPELRGAGSTKSMSSSRSTLATGTGSVSATAPTSATRTASSAEYIVSGIRGHKITALISLIVIAAAIVGVRGLSSRPEHRSSYRIYCCPAVCEPEHRSEHRIPLRRNSRKHHQQPLTLAKSQSDVAQLSIPLQGKGNGRTGGSKRAESAGGAHGQGDTTG